MIERVLQALKPESQDLKMPKATRKSNHVDSTSGNEFQADSNLLHESCSDDEIAFSVTKPTAQAFNKPSASNAANVYAIH